LHHQTLIRVLAVLPTVTVFFGQSNILARITQFSKFKRLRVLHFYDS
jgi:hypothetical protein